MTAQELFSYLTQDAGLDDATAQAIMKAASNEKVASKASTLKQQREYDEIANRAADLEAKYKGTTDKPGAVAYQEWYNKNFAAIQDLQAKAAKYEERYGPLENPKETPAVSNQPVFDESKIAALVDARIQGTYGTQWSNLLKGSGKMIEKHVRSGRKNEIDWDKIGEIAAKKGGDMIAAYDEWDAPEREKATKAAQDAEIERRVAERIAEEQKKRTADFFPAGADASSSSGGLGLRKREDKAAYNRSAVVEAAVTGVYERPN